MLSRLRPLRWRPAPHRHHLSLLAMAMVTVAGLLGLVEYLYLGHRHNADLHTHTQIVARMASAAAVFDSRREANELLTAFAAVPDIAGAKLLRPDGSVLGAYVRDGPADWWQRHGGRTSVREPVQAGGAVVGWLEITADRGELWSALASLVAAMLGVMVAAVALTHLASSRMRTAVRAAEDRTRYLALHDPLTGLSNRAAFTQALEQAVLRAGTGDAAALLTMDLDGFKQINDSHGHAAGDLALQAMADRLRMLVREHDMVARFGGDEFAMLLSGPRCEDVAHRIARQLVEQPPFLHSDTGRRPLGVSIGLAFIPRDATTPKDALQCSDMALYQAKRSGKGHAVTYTSALGDAQRDRFELERDLRDAIANGAITFAYQPIFDRSGQLCHVEALARWIHPRRGPVGPAEFIPIAEEAGLIAELGLQCLDCARRDIKDWRRQGLEVVPVALNLSARQLRRTEDRQRFVDRLIAIGLGPGDIEFELTESVLFEDLHNPDSTLVRLRSMGYRLSIDDFGTGYSSLAYLRRVRCRRVKIDRSFIDGIDDDADNALMVESIVRLVHSMGMLVVAEGVERQADHDRLLSLGCDLFQGYGLARPESADQMAQRLVRLHPPAPAVAHGRPHPAAPDAGGHDGAGL